MIYRFRAILNTSEEVYRDIEIEANATFEDFHNVVTQSFGFDGQDMASFYLSNEKWEQLEEIVLFDMGDIDGPVRTMGETLLSDVVDAKNRNLVYIYDFLNMWTFIVELADIVEPDPGFSYPHLMFAQGEVPMTAQEPEFVSESLDGDDEFDDEYSDDEYINGANDYEDLDFDENWN